MMNYRKIHELTGLIKKWEESHADAASRKSYAEMDLNTAKKNLDAYKRELSELLKESE